MGLTTSEVLEGEVTWLMTTTSNFQLKDPQDIGDLE